MSNLKQSELDDLIGKTAVDAYTAVLLSHQALKKFTIFRYASPPLLQERVEVNEFEKSVIDEALSIRATNKIPFWEAVFSACIKSGRCTDALLTATFFHMGQGDATDYKRRDLESGILNKITDENTLNVGLCSEIQDKHEKYHHLNFMDFHCDVTESNAKIVSAVCREIMPDGFLVFDSGDSYHASSLALL